MNRRGGLLLAGVMLAAATAVVPGQAARGAVTDPAMRPLEMRGDTQVIATAVPVVLGSWTFRTVLRLPAGIRVKPGEVLDIYADARVTNDVGVPDGVRYNIGVGYHLWYYDASAPSGPARDATWVMIGAPGPGEPGNSLGENAIPAVHHLVLNIRRELTVPADWDPAHVMGIALRVGAMSTRWQANGGGDILTVDPYGQMSVYRWGIDPLEARVAELEAAQ